MLQDRPKCWGRDFNSEDRECKGCAWQVGCREKVIKDAVERQQSPPMTLQAPVMTNYYQPQPFPAPQQYSVPQPAQPVQVPTYYQPAVVKPAPIQGPAPAPFQVPAPVQVPQPQYQVVPYKPPVVQAQPAQAPQPPPQVQQPQMVVHDYYGRFQDPLHYQITMAPPPYRPQMVGETFWERLAKNTGLMMTETLLASLILGVRQLVLPPTPRQVDSSGVPIVEK